MELISASLKSVTSCTDVRQVVAIVATLLDSAERDLDVDKDAARVGIAKALSLLRREIYHPAPAVLSPVGCTLLLAWQVRRVREHIDSHIDAPIRVADLAGLVNLSKAHFSRRFRRTFGDTPHAYIMRRRVEIACHLILTSEASLSDIAHRCGFADQPHLCKSFRQFIGLSPAAWRRASSQCVVAS